MATYTQNALPAPATLPVVTPPKWLRLSLLVTSASSAAGAFGLLLCSAGLFYAGYVWWGVSQLGNITVTAIVASVTTVIIDRIIVRHQRAQLTKTLESGQQ